MQECKDLRLSREETKSLTSLQQWLRKLQRDSTTDDEDSLDDSSRAYLHSFRDNFTRYSLFLVTPHPRSKCCGCSAIAAAKTAVTTAGYLS